MGYTIVTYTGQEIDPSEFKPENINLYDIAISLARQRRYAGHTAVPWTVGQHTLLCAMICDVCDFDDKSKKLATLHDFEEFVMQDSIFSIKRQYMKDSYKEDSLKVSRMIYAFFGLLEEFDDPDGKKFIDAIDQSAFVIEALTLKPTFSYDPKDYSEEVNQILATLREKNFGIPPSLLNMNDNDIATALFELSNVIHAEHTLGGEVSAEAPAEAS